jgi:hypothetical protein
MANLNFSDIMGLRSSWGFWDFLGSFRLNNNMDLMDFFCSFSGIMGSTILWKLE